MADRSSSAGIRFVVAVAVMLVMIGVLYMLVRPGGGVESVDPNTPPKFVREAFLTHGTDTLSPLMLVMFDDTLWATFNNDPRIAAIDSNLEVVRWIMLQQSTPRMPLPTGWAVDSAHFYRADHTGGAIEIFARDGMLEHRWDRRPDGHPLLPFALDLYMGNLYVGDVSSGRVLAISVRNDTPFTAVGEMILTMPGFESEAQAFGFITGVSVTPDGRVLIADAEPAGIQAYTCDGRKVYDFKQGALPAPSGARQMAFDKVVFRDLQDTTRFDPSGTPFAGRLHVVDSRSNMIYVYDPYGYLRFTYGQEENLSFPNGIATDPIRRRIIVADTHNKRLVEYKW